METVIAETDGKSEALPVFRTVREAYGSLLRQWRTLLVIAAPLIVFNALSPEMMFRGEIDSPEKLFAWLMVGVISIYFLVVLAVTWIRAVVLNPAKPEILFDSFQRLGLYLKYGLLYAAVAWGPPLATLLYLHSGADARAARVEVLWTTQPWLMIGIAGGAFCLSTFVLARLGLVFPATALDRAINLRSAWRKSSGIFWRFLAIVLLVDAPFVMIDVVFDMLKIDAADGAYEVISAAAMMVEYVGALILLAAVSLVYAWCHNLRSDLASAPQTM